MTQSMTIDKNIHTFHSRFDKKKKLFACFVKMLCVLQILQFESDCYFFRCRFLGVRIGALTMKRVNAAVFHTKTVRVPLITTLHCAAFPFIRRRILSNAPWPHKNSNLLALLLDYLSLVPTWNPAGWWQHCFKTYSDWFEELSLLRDNFLSHESDLLARSKSNSEKFHDNLETI